MTSNQIDYRNNIANKNLTIHDEIDISDIELFIPNQQLEQLLNAHLVGMEFNQAIKTRSKLIKQEICKILGYQVENSFPRAKKTDLNPTARFKGQNFDVYNQSSNNLQIWNAEVVPNRRYVITNINSQHIIEKVKVVNGTEIANLDNTGKLTQKYQASFGERNTSQELVSPTDTLNLIPYLAHTHVSLAGISPVSNPQIGQLLPISVLFPILSNLIGSEFADPGRTQERNRGAGLHRLVCNSLGFDNYADNGQFPDIRNQLLEVKLQTSPTIDLGLVCPDSNESLGITIGSYTIKHSDTRYAVFYGFTDGVTVKVTNLVLTTGQDFFTRFRQFSGTNKKIQMRLPDSFWN